MLNLAADSRVALRFSCQRRFSSAARFALRSIGVILLALRFSAAACEAAS